MTRLPDRKLTATIAKAFRGETGVLPAVRETIRRTAVALRYARERRLIGENGTPLTKTVPRLALDVSGLAPTELLAQFRTRELSPFDLRADQSMRRLSDAESVREQAERIMAHRWSLLGFDNVDFEAEIDWLRDPRSGKRWPLEYHADIQLLRADGSDIRVLWELNRLGHFLVLARAYVATADERFAEEVFNQLESWNKQNPPPLGANWVSAMEVALRATNVAVTLRMLRGSRALTEARLAMVIAILDSHGSHIRRNLEYSYVATGNHYFTNVAGLLWLGLCVPELQAAASWQSFGLREMLRELDKQILPDGAHYELSTGYHRFVTEIVLYSFVACRANGIHIPERYWAKLRAMIGYIRAYLRPDASAPLIGDTDDGRFLPLETHESDDHAYLVALGAAVFGDSLLKIPAEPPVEIAWLLGTTGLKSYCELENAPPSSYGSSLRKDAGTIVLRGGGSYLLMSASKTGLRGRGAHRHNDALSVEFALDGVPFIIDPGSYVYTGDLRERQTFRSTAYHSTVQVDDSEQNAIREATPFIIADEAHPRVLHWEETDESVSATAEHYGYRKLTRPVTHRRTVKLEKHSGCCRITDLLTGEGTHDLSFRFHCAPGVETYVRNGAVELLLRGECKVLVVSPNLDATPILEKQFSSRQYGAKKPSNSIRWEVRATLPLTADFALVPVRPTENAQAKLQEIFRRKG